MPNALTPFLFLSALVGATSLYMVFTISSAQMIVPLQHPKIILLISLLLNLLYAAPMQLSVNCFQILRFPCDAEVLFTLFKMETQPQLAYETSG